MAERRGTKALELWCRRMTEGYPGVKVDNMTTSWRDGLAFCAMIHHFRPDLIDFDKLNKADVYYNNALAFTTAEKYLGIPALLDADDMAAYEVPDRLSILTYLSQYYQAFAAQNSHNRLKRPSSSATEKTQISKPTGPPPKMAHVVGVPRRDPCRKCQLPVFLAERLLVGKKVYHRTCLKCARCGSQLTPGSFYETEVDDQYCCETCPDEEITATNVDGGGDVAAASSVPHPSPPSAEISTEVQLRSKLDGDVSPTITRSVRSSIRDRLAFFEQKQQQTTEKQREGSAESDSKLLQKSLSDEEKSKSLQRMENNSSAMATTSYKMNSALSNFLNDTVDNEPEDQNQAEEDEESLSLTSSAQNSKMDTDSEETDDLTSVSLPPELPKSLPPLVVEQESADEKQKKEEKEEAKRFTASAQLILGGNSTTDSSHLKADEEENIIRSRSQSRSPTNSTGRQTSELKISLRSSLKSHDKTNNNTELEDNDDKAKTIAAQQMAPQPNLTSQMTETIQQIELENNLACNETNDNDCVTKDKAKVNDSMMAMETEIEAAQQLESTTTTTTTALEEVNSTKPSGEKIETSDKPIGETENEVELRTKSLKDNHNTLHASTPCVEDKETTQRLSVVRARLQQFEVITNNEKAKESSPISAATKAKENLNISTPPLTTPPKTPIAPMPIITTTAPTTPPMELKEDESLSRSMEDEQVCATSITQKDPNEDTTMVQMDDDTNTETVTESLEKPPNEKPIQEVPLVMETKDNELLEDKHKSIEKEEAKEEEEEKESAKVEPKVSPPSSSPLRNSSTPNKPPLEEYPEDLNPFKSDDEDEPNEENKENVVLRKPPIPKQPAKVISCNPFDSSDDEIELDKSQNSTISTPKIPPPRPPPPRISRNPFGSEDEDEDLSKASQLRRSSLTASQSKRTPVPTPRTNVSSNNSLNLSAGGTIRSRKSRRAPLPPAPVKELFPSSETLNTSSKASTPSSSTVGTPKSGRKKRPAPAPPKPARLDPSTAIPQIQAPESLNLNTQSKNLLSYPLQSELDSKLSDEEKALLEGKTNAAELAVLSQDEDSRRNSKRLIPLDKELLEEHANESQCDDLKHQQQHLQKSHHHVQESEPNVVYRRLLIPHNLDTPTHESNPLLDELNNSSMLGERQLEKLKDNKEANNRNRQSQISAASSGNEDNDPLFNKSVHGKWKRRKGPAPALPIPPRRVLQMLPLQEIKHELDIIEVQQQGLEKQGVILEKMIRDRCEGENGEPLNAAGEIPPTLDGTSGGVGHQSPALENSKEVENLILQLFELVNEKNELFRRQAELMYLRRQHRLEQEQADLEYEIRVLMAQPERNKTDSDKAREEAFIERLIEVVQLRNEVVECLEMDRIREAEEDQSIKQRLESHIANKRDDEPETKKSSTSKLSKKEKKKQKESKKLAKNKKLDADKDADESELSLDKQKTKKKKKLLIF
ncbi:MICAL-like protein 1 isoform X3 [Stomoxys calcitrans]|uniref:MICAL-like protein 1 isoform X3 n=1 Tax=Stomoxys calcitrans TaxID=35570 RepID=UPI0027E23F0A|nr:MICAL-like protein 1 isoform X3 [Stomoxys calcitrans]